MTEQKKLIFAKAYIDALRNGVNPVDLQPIPETDVLNDEHIQNCLAYVSEILGAVIENGGTEEKQPSEKRHRSRQKFFITEKQKQMLRASDEPMIVSKIAKYISEIAKENDCRTFPATWINNWLVSVGILEISENQYRDKIATQKGVETGVTTTKAISPEGRVYYRNTFNSTAQQFIYDNIDAIIEYNKNL